VDRWRLNLIWAVLVAALALPGVALADTTVDFEQYAAGTTITNQYANLGGTGQGVTFGPLPGGSGGLSPVVRTPPSGQAQSGANVADIATCFACEFFTPNTTGTFAVPRSQVSVDVGYLGTPMTPCSGSPTDSACAVVTLLGYDAAGNQIASSPPTTVSQGAGVHTKLSVSRPTAQIVGFRITASTDATDDNKQIAIDDLTFNTPTTPPTPDFTLTPAATNVNLVTGSPVADAIAIGRLGGSSGSVSLAVSGALPTGVHAQLTPNPAGGASSVLTLTADGDAPPTTDTNPIITVTGTPASAAVGPAARSFSVTVGVQRAFDVSVAGPDTVSVSSCSVGVPIEVTRDLGFPGPVSLSVSGLPPSVQASFAPTQATFPNGSGAQTSTLTLTATESSATTLPRTVTVHATAPPVPERTATFTVVGSCPHHYDPEVLSMQVTQGTQLPVLPARDPADPGAPVSYASIGQSAVAGTQQALAKLAAFKPTIVRVYADLKYGPTGGVTVPAVLKGFRYDSSGHAVPLPGSPILPIASPALLNTGLGAFGNAYLQNNNTGVYTFALPSSWEHGDVQLEADLLPTQSTGLPPVNASATVRAAALPGATPWAPCTTSDCVLDSRFALSHVPFYYTFGFDIRPVAMIQTDPYDATLPDPQSTFAWAQVVTPIPLTIEPYRATIDIGDQIGKSNSDGSVTMELLNRMVTYLCNHGEPDHGADVGIQHNGIRSAQAVGNVCWQDLGLDTHSFAFVNQPQPLTSVTHELFHLLGRPHASPGCGASVGLGGSGTQAAEDWPTDQVGYLQSVGLAPSPGSSPPFQIIPTPAANLGQWYDLMSYCAHIGAGNPLGASQNAWVSVHNWNAILNSFGFLSPNAVHAADARAEAALRPPAPVRARVAAGKVPSLQVTASVDTAGHVTILDVNPVDAAPKSAPSSSFELTATGGGHQVSVPMIASFGHMDSTPPVPLLMLNAVVPAARVSSIAVSGAGRILATRMRSKHAPRVSIPATPSFRGAFAVARWRASDADDDPLTAEIDYSGDGGRTWGLVWMGPNGDHAKLPVRYLYRSARGRIRVLVHDGFRTAVAVSRRFASPGAGPSVQIITPWPHLRQPDGAPLVLSGQAFDDRSRQLTGTHLRWLLGGHVLGTGKRITATNLPAGQRRITLVATDSSGRIGRASTVVRLGASQLLFLTLRAPKRLGREARSLRLTVASSATAVLTVRTARRKSQRFDVGRRARRLRVTVSRGRSPLALHLSLGPGTSRRAVTVTVART
jgi:hypothetical protein